MKPAKASAKPKAKPLAKPTAVPKTVTAPAAQPQPAVNHTTGTTTEVSIPDVQTLKQLLRRNSVKNLKELIDVLAK